MTNGTCVSGDEGHDAATGEKMRVGLLGRTAMLLAAARAVAAAGHEIAFVQTCRPQPHDKAGREDFERLAAETGALFLPSSDFCSTLPAWTDTDADVAISVNWPTLVPAQALWALAYGILNAHAGDLPRYRGNACPNWAILNFEATVGLTVHLMVEALDAGPVLARSTMPIDETTYVGDIYRWLATEIPDLFVQALSRLPDGFVAQDPAVRPLRTYPRRDSDSRIDWRAPTRDVLALVRASSSPFAGAWTTLEERNVVRIFRARAYVPAFDVLAMPGQVCLAHGANPVIATGDGMIEIEDCRCDGRDPAGSRALVLSSLRNRLI